MGAGLCGDSMTWAAHAHPWPHGLPTRAHPWPWPAGLKVRMGRIYPVDWALWGSRQVRGGWWVEGKGWGADGVQAWGWELLAWGGPCWPRGGAGLACGRDTIGPWDRVLKAGGGVNWFGDGDLQERGGVEKAWCPGAKQAWGLGTILETCVLALKDLAGLGWGILTSEAGRASQGQVYLDGWSLRSSGRGQEKWGGA